MSPLAMLYMLRDAQEQKPVQPMDWTDPLYYGGMAGPPAPTTPHRNYRDPEQAGPAPPGPDRLARMYAR